MIVHPEYWRDVGRPVKLKDVEDAISKVLSEISCNCLSLSGGLDSSLMLYFMLQRHKHVRTFTIGLSEDHPDIMHAQLVVCGFRNKVSHNYYIPTQEAIKTEERPGDLEGDAAVRLFYRFVEKETPEIIACDGLDEFMAGYYAHQETLSETTYFNLIRRLQREHLAPLNKNSGKVNVYLPYLDSRLISLYSRISLSEKVDLHVRKKFIVRMAEGKLPDRVITRRKYGFCDALKAQKGGKIGGTRNPLIDGNDMWDWNEGIAQGLLSRFSRKQIEEVRASPQMVCNCFRCTKAYMDKMKPKEEYHASIA